MRLCLLEEVTVRRGGRRVVEGFSLSLRCGEIVALLGSNGCGKSTVLMTIAGSLEAECGRVEVVGVDVTGLEDWARCRRDITLVPQTHYLYENLTIAENINVSTAYTPAKGRSARRASAASLWARQFPGIGLKSGVSRLSAGEARFLSILCGVARGSSLLLLDEPSAGLSGGLAEKSFRFLRSGIGRQNGAILAEQRWELAKSIADRVIVLEGGQIAWEGPSDQLVLP